ncbi:CHAT domain-containing protein [Roseibium sp. AS2]|uniref:CHAT domain-containing protein n=1 Tax=Roseibium sp. AS2 TaxID=3135781 RepID=UPI003171FE9B
MEFDILAELLDATDLPPKLLVMNACNTLDGSDILLEAVPVLIAMSDTVGDAGAGVFASQFYAAIASAQSVGSALRQAKAMMKQALLREDAELPQILSRPDTDPNEVVLIKPPNKG